MIRPDFWQDRRVFLTGHTGFKGAWTSLLLRRLGAIIHGFSLPPRTDDEVFVAANIVQDVHHVTGDVCDLPGLERALDTAKPDIVIHMAAQALVRLSYVDPVETYRTNVMGTVNVLEAARRSASVRAVIIVTSDKCYENSGWDSAYKEGDRLGGHDPYSNSKGCAELVIDAYRRSFFHLPRSPAVASARAGNVIGGGDWATDRLVPDAMRAFMTRQTLQIRFPDAVRPWQHVFDPVVGYLQLAERLLADGQPYGGAWNFGPGRDSEVPVRVLVEKLATQWGAAASWQSMEGEHPHEASCLKLDCSKAHSKLAWRPLIDLDSAVRLTVDWYRAATLGADLRAFSLQQVDWLLDRVLESDRTPSLAGVGA